MIKRLIVTAVLLGAIVGCGSEPPPPAAAEVEAAKAARKGRDQMIEKSAKTNPQK